LLAAIDPVRSAAFITLAGTTVAARKASMEEKPPCTSHSRSRCSGTPARKTVATHPGITLPCSPM
jgi:hypothetical protein